MQERINPTPFSETLINAGLSHSRFVKIESLPDMVVRRTWLNAIYPLESHINDMRIGKRLHNELKNKYGINIPNYTVVIGPENTVYTITRRIEGRTLKTDQFAPEESGEIIPQLDHLVASLCRYFQDKYYNGQPFLSDINIGQFMYGKLIGELEPSIYLADVDFHYDAGTSINDIPPTGRLPFSYRIEELRKFINDAENMFEGARLSMSRKVLIEFLESIPQTWGNYDEALSVVEKLKSNDLNIPKKEF
jgi:hypothetical protein